MNKLFINSQSNYNKISKQLNQNKKYMTRYIFMTALFMHVVSRGVGCVQNFPQLVIALCTFTFAMHEEVQGRI